MFRRLISLILAAAALCACIPPAGALGNDQLVPSSSTRRMTKAECWGWSYEALGFVYHEILARHGFIFDENGEYGWYFTSQYWYHSISTRNNQDVYDQLNNTEWYNIDLIKSVREDMRQMHTTNPGGKPAPTHSDYYQHNYSEPPAPGGGSWF
ncbi:MAG: YARHG domain-containing protein [Clostridia bacterium]|nr:YARHG domain-containing protein [Clostridia bacterium]